MPCSKPSSTHMMTLISSGFGLSMSSLIFVNTMLNYESLDWLPVRASGNFSNISAANKILYISNGILTLTLFLNFWRINNILLRQAIYRDHRIKLGYSFYCKWWRKETAQKILPYFSFVCSAYMGFSIGVNCYIVLAQNIVKKTTNIIISIFCGMLSGLFLWFYFKFNPGKKEEQKTNLPDNIFLKKMFIIGLYIIGYTYSFGITFISTNTILQFINTLFEYNISFNYNDNSANKNILLSLILALTALPKWHVLGKACQGIMFKSIFKSPTNMTAAKHDQQSNQYCRYFQMGYDYYVALWLSAVQAASIILLLLHALGKNQRNTALGCSIPLSIYAFICCTSARIGLYRTAGTKMKIVIATEESLLIPVDMNDSNEDDNARQTSRVEFS